MQQFMAQMMAAALAQVQAEQMALRKKTAKSKSDRLKFELLKRERAEYEAELSHRCGDPRNDRMVELRDRIAEDGSNYRCLFCPTDYQALCSYPGKHEVDGHLFCTRHYNKLYSDEAAYAFVFGLIASALRLPLPQRDSGPTVEEPRSPLALFQPRPAPAPMMPAPSMFPQLPAPSMFPQLPAPSMFPQLPAPVDELAQYELDEEEEDAMDIVHPSN